MLGLMLMLLLLPLLLLLLALADHFLLALLVLALAGHLLLALASHLILALAGHLLLALADELLLAEPSLPIVGQSLLIHLLPPNIRLLAPAFDHTRIAPFIGGEPASQRYFQLRRGDIDVVAFMQDDRIRSGHERIAPRRVRVAQ